MVVVARAFEEGAASRPGVHRETNLNAQLSALRTRATEEIFGGDTSLFEQVFAAWYSAYKERFDSDSSRAKTLISMLREWFDEFQRDATAFIQKITEALRRMIEKPREDGATHIHH